MLAAALPSPSAEVSRQPAEISRRRLSLRHVRVAPARDMHRETALRTETILAPLMMPARAAANEKKPAAPLTTERMFQGQGSVEILHNGEAYTLRITSKGKLILTK